MDGIRTNKKTAADPVESLLTNLASLSWTPGLTRESYKRILSCGFRSGNAELAAIATEIALEHKPITVRGVFYQLVSAGVLPSTDKQHYDRTGRLLSRLRECGVIPYQWIVDNLRQTQKPSSWSGLSDFANTVRNAYRMDFWEHLPSYVHVFCEKDAVAGTIHPVTNKYDVALSPVRGYVSDSFAHEIGHQFATIDKPVYCAYLGDYDPSGFDIERDLKEKLAKHSNRKFYWRRLGVVEADFDKYNLVKLKPKKQDRRYKKFVAEHGDYAAEIDAIPPNELRTRIDAAINEHIPQGEWERLQNVEQAEQESWSTIMDKFGGAA